MSLTTIEKLALGTKSAPKAWSVPTTTGGITIASTNDKRISFSLYNVGPNTIYIGRDSSVTTSNGFPVPAGGSYVDTETSDAWRAVAETGSCDVRTIEVTGGA